MKNLVFTAIALNLFAYITIRLRSVIFKTKLYRPKIWNFKLSLLPSLVLIVNIVTVICLKYLSVKINFPFISLLSYVIFLIFFIWVIFLPNAGYLITELNLNHRLKDSNLVPIWYDIVSMLSFALSGVVNTLVNVTLIQLFVLISYAPKSLSSLDYIIFNILTLFILVLASVGIYFGREIRLNSWDVLHYKNLINKLKIHYSKKSNRHNFILFLILHVIFLVIMYNAMGIPYFFVRGGFYENNVS